ncbi:helix-turn-helix domain-containing protein [Antribacter gilvus]|uniref:helix-turn-helix domain-containing protein n=1 Tax=Antribacter gilvus TaxID=2304675 RepID=UPI00197FC4D6|nr:helix-turn-helix transcriptional regulator [Antribacter gilvus]
MSKTALSRQPVGPPGTTGELITRLRLSRGLSMSTLARNAGVPTSTISRIETGRMQPSLAMLRRIAAAAGFRLVVRVTDVPDGNHWEVCL